MAWLRRAVLQIGTPGSSGREFADLRIRFRANMADDATPAEAAIELFNPSPRSIALAQAPDAVVRLAAGYLDDPPRLVFAGEPIEGGVLAKRQGTDRVLTIEAQDGGRDLAAAFLDETWDEEATLLQFATAAAGALGLPLGTFNLGASDPRLPRLTMYGPVREQLDRVAALGGLRWSIRDRALHIWPAKSSTGESAVLFSTETGNLIGSPTQRDEGRVQVRALLAPTMRPGKPFRVFAEVGSGDYVAEEVVFRGDTHGQDWYTEVVGRPR